MRTTLDIDDDVLEAAKELAAGRSTTAGRVISDLLRIALGPRKRSVRSRNGVPVLATRKRAALVTRGIVNRLRDDK